MRAGSVGGLDKNVFNVGATPHWARHAIWAVTRTSNGSGPAARSAVQDRKKKRTRTSPSVTQGCVCVVLGSATRMVEVGFAVLS